MQGVRGQGSDKSREKTRGGLGSRVRGLDLMQNQWELVGKIESHLFLSNFLQIGITSIITAK